MMISRFVNSMERKNTKTQAGRCKMLDLMES